MTNTYSDRWSLFENRPARERTSSLREVERHQPRVFKVDTWASAQRIVRVIRAEPVKC